jgi:hypothetical protein
VSDERGDRDVAGEQQIVDPDAVIDGGATHGTAGAGVPAGDASRAAGQTLAGDGAIAGDDGADAASDVFDPESELSGAVSDDDEA